MGSPTAWLLNFEADEELAIGGTFTPSAKLARQLTSLRKTQAHSVIGPRDRELGEGCEGMQAQAWCPTPTALEEIRKAGAIAPKAPSFDVLRWVNSREFCASLPEDDSEGFFATEERTLLAGLAAARPAGGWLLKRNFGTSGRGQLRLAGETPTEQEASWIGSSWRAGGLRVEPYRRLAGEFSIHGWVAESGEFTLAGPCAMPTDAGGRWLETRLVREDELTRHELAALLSSAELCAKALAQADYFGAFGVDAYRWLDEAGDAHFQSRSEINARYTLGWRIGFGESSESSA